MPPLTRNDRVRILCTTLLEYLPPLKTSSGQLARSADPRPVTQDVAPCTLCLGRGRTRSGRACLLCPSKARYRGHQDPVDHHCQECIVCEGSGWRRTRRGEEPHDVMTGLSQSELAVAAESPSPIQRRREASDIEGDRLEIARRARDRAGSYRELERALEKLRDREPPAYSLVWHVLVCGEPITLDATTQQRLSDVIEWLAREMHQVRVPAWALPSNDLTYARKKSLWYGRTNGHARQRIERNEMIRQEYMDGRPVSDIARDYGLTRETASRIIHRPAA